MPALAHRSLLVFLAATVAIALVPAVAFATPSSPRLRVDRGPAPLPVFAGTSRTVRHAASPITMRPSHAVPATTIRSAPAPRSSAPAPATPVASTHFDAIPQWKTDYPADPTGAVGVTNIVTAVNTAVAVYARDGSELLPPTDLASLIPGVQGQKFDPKIVYDQYTSTFVLTFLVRRPATRQSWIVVTAIPDATASDETTWCGTKLHGDTVPKNGKQWADYTEMGYDSDSIAIDTNAFTFGGPFAYAQIYSIANTDLFGTCDPASPVTFTPLTGDSTRNPDGAKAFTIQPAQTQGASNGDQYFLSYGRSGALVVWRLRETAAGLRLTNAAIAVKPEVIPPFGTQAGGSYRNPDTWWDPGDLRLVNAFYDADLGRIYTAHAVAANLKPDTMTGGYIESAIRWYEVEPAGRLRRSTVTRTGIVGAPEVDSGWPMVATDASGNLFMTFSRASKPRKEYLSAWAAEIPPGATKAQLTLLTAGTARMENRIRGNPVERWGDFNGINRDPVDGAFVAMVNQYAKGDGSSTVTDNWQQTFDLISDG
ncbi:MAG: hypothetical protein ACXVP7_12515 [Actinomycetota bacterium]